MPHLCISSIMKCYFNKIFHLSIAHRRDHSWGIRWIFVVLNCLFLMVNAQQVKTCSPGLETAGWTVPEGDIFVKHGDNLQIWCNLNETFVAKEYPGSNSSNIFFIRDNTTVEQKFVTIINKTTALLTIESPPAGWYTYSCDLDIAGDKDAAVCLNIVFVAYEPQVPSNFTCRSYNWENITCTWEVSKNYIPTTHKLFFKMHGARGRKLFPCPTAKAKNDSCTWTQYTNPIYRQTYENFTFVMQIQNMFGNKTVIYKIDHYAIVIPAKPTLLSVTNKTSDSATLCWECRFPMKSFPPGLTHKVMYQNQWDHKKNWKVINIDTEPHLHKRCSTLTGLYPNTAYDARVYLRSAKAVEEDMYSEPAVIIFRTSPTLPSFPPRTDIGSFEIVENNGNRDIYLYWQMIQQYYENGNKFKYQVNHVEENDHKIVLEPIEMTKTYAKFKGLSFNKYRFKIVSENEAGINKNYTEIIVPSRDEMPREPIAFTRMAFENGLYELSWKPPILHKDITNYTIFWCDNERDRPYQCTGYLNWTHVSMNTTVYNITVPDSSKIYQFAISANTNKGSSGMIWSYCTVIHSKALGKMKSIWINRIGSDFIDVGWKLECSDRIGSVEEMKIYYCPIVSPLNAKCKEPKRNVTVKSYPPIIKGIVKNLTPYTTYMLEVTTVTKNGESQPSESLYNTTLEAAPSSSPLNVKAINVTNTTMFITWQPPEAMNGVLRYYEVYYNGFMKKVEEGNDTKLTNLLAYTKYTISVTACTVACSEKSPMITTYTEIGIPGKISIPKVHFMNSSQVRVRWNPPEHPAGPINLAYYEIEATSGEIQNVTNREAQLSIPDCKTDGKLYKFRVRAININSNNERLTGPWSETGEGNCYSNGLSRFLIIVISVIGFILVVVSVLGLAYYIKRWWLKIQDMQNINVKLPPGLTSNMKLLHKDGEPHKRQPSADSSGCSSGQESVTSSVTTTEFQISSDSGTEIDPVPVSFGKTASTWESNSISVRQRSLSRGPETTSCRESYIPVKTGDPNINENISLTRSTPNLTDSTGNTTTLQTWPSTGYMSMLSSENLLDNPSPMSRENTMVNTTGSYSLIGIRTPMQTTSDEDGDDGIDSAKTVHDTLISVKTGVNLAHNSYLPFVMRKEVPKTLDTFNLNTFVKPDKFEEDALISHLTASDKTTSKPFFQPNLMNTVHEPLALWSPIEQSGKNNIRSFPVSTSPTNSCNKSFVSPFMNPTLPISSIDTTSTPLTDTISTNSHISDPKSTPSETSRLLTQEKNKDTLKSQKLSHVSHNSAPSESFSKPSVLASFVPQMLQQQEKIELPPSNVIEDVKEREIEKDSATYLPLPWDATTKDTNERSIQLKVKQNSGYVVLSDLQLSNSTIQQKPTTNQSDEQYSKVTVVPNTMQ